MQGVAGRGTLAGGYNRGPSRSTKCCAVRREVLRQPARSRVGEGRKAFSLLGAFTTVCHERKRITNV